MILASIETKPSTNLSIMLVIIMLYNQIFKLLLIVKSKFRFIGTVEISQIEYLL